MINRILKTTVLASMIIASMPSTLNGLGFFTSWINTIRSKSTLFSSIQTIAAGVASYLIYTCWNSGNNTLSIPESLNSSFPKEPSFSQEAISLKKPAVPLNPFFSHQPDYTRDVSALSIPGLDPRFSKSAWKSL